MPHKTWLDLMLNTLNNSHVNSITLLSTILVLLLGCSTTTTLTGERDDPLAHIKIERIDSSSATITQAYLQHSEDILMLRGVLKPRLNKRGITPGHLHVEVIDSSGDVTEDSIVRYQLKCRATGTSKFIYKTRKVPGSIKIIRITQFWVI